MSWDGMSAFPCLACLDACKCVIIPWAKFSFQEVIVTFLLIKMWNNWENTENKPASWEPWHISLFSQILRPEIYSKRSSNGYYTLFMLPDEILSFVHVLTCLFTKFPLLMLVTLVSAWCFSSCSSMPPVHPVRHSKRPTSNSCKIWLFLSVFWLGSANEKLYLSLQFDYKLFPPLMTVYCFRFRSD